MSLLKKAKARRRRRCDPSSESILLKTLGRFDSRAVCSLIDALSDALARYLFIFRSPSDARSGLALALVAYAAPPPPQWCGPCRKFTPLFAITYEDLPDKDEVEVIFVSSDHEQDGFDEYYAEQPWAAIPFDFPGKDAIGEKFAVEGIPRVVVLSGVDGSIVNGDARTAIVAKKSLAGLF